MSVWRRSQSSPQGSRRAISLGACIVFGAAIGGFAALGAMRFAEAFGNLLPIAAAAFGALAGRVFFSTLSWKMNEGDESSVSATDVDGAADEMDSAEQSGALGSQAAAMPDAEEKADAAPIPPPAEPEWPVETHDVQVKLDLARSYVEMDDPELALQYLQEVLELEAA